VTGPATWMPSASGTWKAWSADCLPERAVLAVERQPQEIHHAGEGAIAGLLRGLGRRRIFRKVMSGGIGDGRVGARPVHAEFGRTPLETERIVGLRQHAVVEDLAEAVIV